MSRNAAGGDQAAIVSGDNDRGAAVARQQQQLLCEWHVTPVGNAYALNTLLMIWTLSFEMVRCVRIKAVVWNPCMNDIYLRYNLNACITDYIRTHSYHHMHCALVRARARNQ